VTVVQDTENEEKPVKIYIKNILLSGVFVRLICGGGIILMGNENPAKAGFCVSIYCIRLFVRAIANILDVHIK
jgi:hypothetical protein